MGSRLGTIIAIIAIAVIIIITIQSVRSENSWRCTNGQWVKHGNPTNAMPTTPCNK